MLAHFFGRWLDCCAASSREVVLDYASSDEGNSIVTLPHPPRSGKASCPQRSGASSYHATMRTASHQLNTLPYYPSRNSASSQDVPKARCTERGKPYNVDDPNRPAPMSPVSPMLALCMASPVATRHAGTGHEKAEQDDSWEGAYDAYANSESTETRKIRNSIDWDCSEDEGNERCDYRCEDGDTLYSENQRSCSRFAERISNVKKYKTKFFPSSKKDVANADRVLLDETKCASPRSPGSAREESQKEDDALERENVPDEHSLALRLSFSGMEGPFFPTYHRDPDYFLKTTRSPEVERLFAERITGSRYSGPSRTEKAPEWAHSPREVRQRPSRSAKDESRTNEQKCSTESSLLTVAFGAAAAPLPQVISGISDRYWDESHCFNPCKDAIHEVWRGAPPDTLSERLDNDFLTAPFPFGAGWRSGNSDDFTTGMPLTLREKHDYVEDTHQLIGSPPEAPASRTSEFSGPIENTIWFDMKKGRLGVDVGYSRDFLYIMSFKPTVAPSEDGGSVRQKNLMQQYNDRHRTADYTPIQVGDLIVKVNKYDRPAQMSANLRSALEEGARISMTILKRRRHFTIVVPPTTKQAQENPFKLGITCAMRQNKVIVQKVKKGIVPDLGFSIAERKCVCIGDEIAEANGASRAAALTVLNRWVREPEYEQLKLVIVAPD